MLNTFNYSSPHELLRDRWEEKKKANPSFSIRSWAKKLGFKSNASLNLMMQGKRSIPRKYISLFIKDLDLTIKEGIFFETLVNLSREKTREGKEYYLKRLRQLRGRAVEMTELETFKFLEDPLHGQILELINLKDFTENLAWIKRRLKNRYTTSKIKFALSRLLKLGLLTRDQLGNLVKSKLNISSKADVFDESVQKYHQNVSQLAIEAVAKQKIDEREFNSHTFCLDKVQLKKAKRMIRNFTQEFLSEIAAEPKTGNEVYQINLQMFKIT